MNRQTALSAFLKTTDWTNTARTSVAGDASNRRYDRLTKPEGETAILMDAPPEKGEDIRPFIKIAKHLRSIRLNAPEIISHDSAQGFLILEDLGDDLFSRILNVSPQLEHELYSAAIDVLTHLHQHPCPPLDAYDSKTMAPLSGLAYDWYCYGAKGAMPPEHKAAFISEFTQILNQLHDMQNVLIQRDYHAENLIWMPERKGVQKVGLLDFQDAMSGHCAYDLVSILQDARRDVSPEVQSEMKQRYISQNNLDADAFEAAYAILGTQRNMRILGVFSRLCLRDGKAHYVDLIPRVWAHLQTNLTHPALSRIANRIQKDLPYPNKDTLNELKSKCASFPHL